jgi:hypothetical protein
MLDTATVVDLALDHDDKARGQDLDHRQIPQEDLASVLTTSVEVAAGEIGITMTCVMSSAAEMRKVGLRTDVRSTSALIRSDVKRGTMIIMVPIMTNLTNNALPWEDTTQEKSKPFPTI